MGSFGLMSQLIKEKLEESRELVWHSDQYSLHLFSPLYLRELVDLVAFPFGQLSNDSCQSIIHCVK